MAVDYQWSLAKAYGAAAAASSDPAASDMFYINCEVDY
jgi:hypothetical protein